MVTLTTLDQRLTVLEKHDSESYKIVRDLKNLVETNHLAVMHQLGEIAKVLLKGKKR